jgi:hypothetical protein
VGDLDGDGTTTRSDAAIVLRNLGRASQSHRGTGDIDGDQATTLADLALIQWNLGSTIAPSTPAPSTPAPSTPVPSALAATLPAPSAAPPDSIPRQTVRAAADRIVSHSDSPHASELPERIRWTRARRIVRTRPAPAIDRALDTVLNHHIPAAPRRARIEEVRSESVSR